MKGIDWPALVSVGLTELRLAPDELWRLTPIEFLLLTGISARGGATTRETLERLSRDYPDERKSE